MRKDKERALKLRLKGLSYNEINRELGVPKSTLSEWLRGVQLSQKAQSRLKRRHTEKSFEGLLKRNKQQVHEARQKAHEIRIRAKSDIDHLTRRELLILGAALYWGEGYKRPIIRNGVKRTHHVISLSNTDPKLVKIFIRFLHEVCNIPKEKIKVSVRIYQHMNEKGVLKFWMAVTRLPKENFNKTLYGISKSSEHKRPFNRLPYGTVQIRVGDTKMFHKIMGWIEGLKDLSN